MIKITVGISNSGKSTWAHEQWLKNPQSTVIINRDKIRELLFSYIEDNVSEYYSRADLSKLEKQVTKYEDTLIYEALNENKTVIVDATHLEEKYIRRFEYWNVPIEIIWFDVLLKEALTRDIARTRKVGSSIINSQYGKYLKIRKDFSDYSFAPVEIINDKYLEPCYLLDIDGTVAHMTDRSPYDWSRVSEDYVDTSVKRVSNSIFTTYSSKIFVCTGRDGSCLEETVKWLDTNNINYDKIFIRKESDTRPDWVVKEEMWRTIAKDYFIAGLIDDRQQVVRRARLLGLKVFQVAYNNF